MKAVYQVKSRCVAKGGRPGIRKRETLWCHTFGTITRRSRTIPQPPAMGTPHTNEEAPSFLKTLRPNAGERGNAGWPSFGTKENFRGRWLIRRLTSEHGRHRTGAPGCSTLAPRRSVATVSGSWDERREARSRSGRERKSGPSPKNPLTRVRRPVRSSLW